MILRVLVLAPLLAGSISVVYCACIAATGRLLGSPIWSPAVAYASALPCVMLAAVSWNRPRSGAMEAVMRYVWKRPLQRWTALAGGVLGACIGLAVAFVPPRVGLGPFFVLFVAGQVFAAFVLDRNNRIWGNLAVILGVAVFQARTLRTLSEVSLASGVTCLGIAFLAGASAVLQGAANGSLTHILHGSYMSTAVFSFGSGLCILVLIAYTLQPHGPRWERIHWQQDWWKLCGGVLAVSSMLTMTLMPRLIGFGRTTSWMVAGELITSLLVDHYGWLGFRQNQADYLRSLGVAIVLAGVVSLQKKDEIIQPPILATKEEVTTSEGPQASTPPPLGVDHYIDDSPFKSAATLRPMPHNFIDV